MTSSAKQTVTRDDTPPSRGTSTTLDVILEVCAGYSVLGVIATARTMPDRQARFDEAKRITEASIDRLKARVRPKDRRLVFEALVLAGLPSGVAASCVGLLRDEVEPWGKHRRSTWQIQ